MPDIAFVSTCCLWVVELPSVTSLFILAYLPILRTDSDLKWSWFVMIFPNQTPVNARSVSIFTKSGSSNRLLRYFLKLPDSSKNILLCHCSDSFVRVFANQNNPQWIRHILPNSWIGLLYIAYIINNVELITTESKSYSKFFFVLVTLQIV